MVDAFLVITAIVMAVLLLGAALVILIIFSHPDDNTPGARAWLPKVITVLGLWLAFASVLILPYDVANQRGQGGGLSIDVLWKIVYLAMAAMLIVVIPFAFWYYESNDSDEEARNKKWCTLNGQWGTALKYTLVTSLLFLLICVILYSQLNEAQVPTTLITKSAFLATPVGQNALYCGGPTTSGAGTITSRACDTAEYKQNIQVSFPVYLLSLVSFLGWWFFTLFAGVGLVALPLDLINEFRTRPTPMTTSAYFEERRKLGERAEMLIEYGERIKTEIRGKRSRKEKAADKKHLLKFEQYYYFLKQDYKILEAAKAMRGNNWNPFVPWLKLLVGVLGAVVTVVWLLHICLYILPEPAVDPFLNTYLITLTDLAGGKFPLLGVLTYAIFSLWLMAAVVKGNFKLGVRFLIFKIYPMEVNNTLMNAFLFNTWMIMLTAIPLVQFCVAAFPIYARETDIDIIFGTQIQYLKGFTYFWAYNVFVYVLVILAFLSAFYLAVFPKDKAASIEMELNRMASEKPPKM